MEVVKEMSCQLLEHYVEQVARNGMNIDRQLLLLHDPQSSDVTQAGMNCARFGELRRRISTSELRPLQSADTLQPGFRAFVAHQLGLFGNGNRQQRFTRHYLSQRPWAARWHHIRMTEPEDWARCSRLLVGQGIGLCLSGGGAKGNVQFGVIKAMEELGIPIDVVSGTSFGALTGAIYSMTAAEPGSMMRVVEKVMGTSFTTRGMLADFNFPRTACFTGQYLNNVLQRTFARRRCEDMLVPFVCTSTDILNFEAKSHREGPLWRIIRASMSLVGFVPPLPHQEHCTETNQDVSSLLVDGGYTNLFPTEDLRQLGARTVICVKACPDFEAVSTDYGDSVRGGAISALRRLGIPWRWYKGPDPPNQGEIQERLMYLPDMMKGSGKDGMGADILIKPPIAGYGVLCFSKYPELVQKGYDVALPVLKAWLDGKEGNRGDHVKKVIEQRQEASGQETKLRNKTLLETGYGPKHSSMRKVMSTPDLMS